MPKAVQAFEDEKGGLHKSLEQATQSEIARKIFGSAESMAPSLAATVLKNRTEIERIFREYDECKFELTSGEET
ncbi:MAG: hypothetical protein Unbinned4120contig1000_38 [Prokaryotic dsDNA virus sp.]|jgi:hypothetical protein|nr:MAG: hypothetical protein Unbinned4120contig1000_38 [Prokaryotic dsDNA virus sp.]|tara:strand:- start:30752 stop:30973 length:222 start_codon:yes stop_codon:yes gene_type:complete